MQWLIRFQQELQEGCSVTVMIKIINTYKAFTTLLTP